MTGSGGSGRRTGRRSVARQDLARRTTGSRAHTSDIFAAAAKSNSFTAAAPAAGTTAMQITFALAAGLIIAALAVALFGLRVRSDTLKNIPG